MTYSSIPEESSLGDSWQNALLNSLDAAYLLIDSSGKIHGYNQTWQEISTGFGVLNLTDKGIGNNFFDILNSCPSSDKNAAPDIRNKMNLLLNGFSVKVRRDFPVDNGDSIQWYIFESGPVKNKKGYFYITVKNITPDVEARNELNEISQRYQQLADISGTIILTLGTDEQILWGNKAWNDIMQGEFQEGEKRYIKNCFTRTIIYEEFTKRFREVLNGKTVRFSSVKLQTPSRRIVYMEGQMIPVFLNEKIAHVQCYLKDVTESITNVRAIKRLSTKLGNIYNTLNLAFWGFDAVNKKNIYVSPGHERIFLRPSVEFLQNPRRWHELVYAEDRNLLYEVDAAMLRGETSTAEYRIILPDGSLKWVQGHMIPVMDEQGRLVEIDGITIDIDDRKKAEESKQKSEKLLQEVSRHIPGVVFRVQMNQEGNITFPYISESAEILVGLPIQEVMLNAEQAFKFIHSDDVSEVMEKLVRSSVTLEVFEMLFRVYSTGGVMYWVRGHANPHRLPDGSTEWNGTLNDVTALKKAEEILESNYIQLQKASGEIDRFVYSISHDLRGPILSILGLIELAEEPDQSQEEIAEYFSLMKKGVQRLDNTIREILNYWRNAKMDIYPEKVQLYELVHLLFEDVMHLNVSRQIKFINLIEKNTTIVSDRMRIRTLLSNLITNAAKYRRKDEVDSFIEVSFKENENTYTIAVKDNGEGIPAAQQEKVFEMFYRNSQKSVGSGLGLYICRDIARKMGGDILLKSEFGAGSTFEIILPKIQLNENENLVD